MHVVWDSINDADRTTGIFQLLPHIIVHRLFNVFVQKRQSVFGRPHGMYPDLVKRMGHFVLYLSHMFRTHQTVETVTMFAGSYSPRFKPWAMVTVGCV